MIIKVSFLFALLLLTTNILALNSHIFYETDQNVNKESGQTKRSEWVGASIDHKGAWRKINNKMSGDLKYSKKYSDYIISFPEFYIEYSSTKIDWGLGRKVLDWNDSESFWLLTDLHNSRGFSLLDDKREGLFGLHIDKKKGRFQYSTFISLIHLPSMNPGYVFRDGKILANQEWVSIPPKYMEFKDRLLPLHYNINTPKVSDVIYQNTLGFRLGYSWNKGKFSGFAIYKPETFWRQHIEGKLSKEYDYEKVEIDINPSVNYHVVYGLDIDHKISNIDMGLGYKIVDPNADFEKKFPIVGRKLTNTHKTFDSDYFQIEPSYQQQRYFHAQTKYNGNIFDLDLYYFHLLKGGDSGDYFSGDSIKWRQALGFLFKYDFSERFNMFVNMKYDLKLKDNIVKSEASYIYKKRLLCSLGFEFLKADSSKSYWSSYRSNDTIYSTVGLIF